MFLLCTVFLWADFFLHRMVYYFYKKEIIPFLCTEFRLFQCWYVSFFLKIISHPSPNIFRPADHFWCEWTLCQLPILSITRLNERLWRSEFHPCISCFGELFFVRPEFLNLAPTFRENFSPIEHFAVTDCALRTYSKNNSQSAVFHFDMS